MRLPWFSAYFVAAFALATLGCNPEIGDACQIHSECSATGDRLCDPTFPGGYCTVFNCEPGGCPDEAVCVAYGTVLSSEPVCTSPEDGTRFTRTFCMKSCGSDSDCRSGYDCVNLSESNPWGAVVVERGSHPKKVCTVAPPEATSADEHSTEVCNPPADASFPPPPDGAPDPLPAEGGAEGGATEAGTKDGSSDAAPEAGRDGAVDGGPDAGGTDSGARDAAFADAADAQGDR